MLLINKRTKQALDAFLEQPAHGLVIFGPNGAGKDFLAKLIASTLLNVPESKLMSCLDFIYIGGEQVKSIGITEIRQLKSDVKLKNTSSEKISRVVLISHAEKLTIEAQNALLKLLEEPNDNNLIILTAINASELLTTINSRLQSIVIRPVSLKLAQQYSGLSKSEIESIWRLSAGMPGLLISLLAKDKNHELYKAIELAKSILGQPVYERLNIINQIVADTDQVQLLFDSIEKVLSATHSLALSKNELAKADRILSSRLALYNSRQRHDKGCNLKLNLLELFVSV